MIIINYDYNLTLGSFLYKFRIWCYGHLHENNPLFLYFVNPLFSETGNLV